MTGTVGGTFRRALWKFCQDPGRDSWNTGAMVTHHELVASLDGRILATGRRFLEEIRREQPSLFDKARWTGKVMDWVMHNEHFKVQLLRFVDVFPALKTSESLARHLEEYFGGDDGAELPAVMKLGSLGAKYGGRLGAAVLGKAISANIRELARQFIIGETTDEAIANATKLREGGFGIVIDLLGEAAVSEAEAAGFQAAYLELIEALAGAAAGWATLDPNPESRDPNPNLDWGFAPRVQVSVKPSALYSRLRPVDFEGAVSGVMARLRPIYRRVIEVGGMLALDMESHQHKDITLEAFRRLRMQAGFRHWPHVCIVLQAYLRETDHDLNALLDWARAERLPFAIRLVKGAYWDYETVVARQNGWPIPVYQRKWETDAAFERLARRILEQHELVFLACGSHNIRSIAAVLETAKELGVPETRYEFQVLHGMAEPVRKALGNLTGRVRLYCPYGELVPGMAYLVRRLLENTANESFLRQTFVEGVELEQLLADPAQRKTSCQPVPAGAGKVKSFDAAAAGIGSSVGRENARPPFASHPAADFTRAEERAAFPAAIAEIRRRQLGRTYPLHIGGREVFTADRQPSRNPNHFTEVPGQVCQAGVRETELAIAAAEQAFPAWRDTAPPERAELLFKAAEVMRRRLHELAAWQVLEVGKQWAQAHADVSEAIDFLEYYGREMLRLGAPQRLGSVAGPERRHSCRPDPVQAWGDRNVVLPIPGEDNRLFYEPHGVAAVIAPWNFPLAISTGMAGAAVVTGNCVVYKPSGLSSIIGHQLVEVFQEAGLPDGVFNYLPGRGAVMGDFLVEHPAVSLIAFTGSLGVGRRIYQKAAAVHPGQRYLKRVICELGGKNALIIDDDADLDEAVPHVLQSAFGYQGQKCSACSRVIVLNAVYDRFVERLVEAARSLKIGPAEDPANDLGAVIYERAMKNVLNYAALAKREGTLLFESPVTTENPAGWYVPVTIVGDIRPEHRLAQEEVFGPVLAVMRAKDFDQAIAWANTTEFALTGGVFSRSPRHLEQARREFCIGNLYLNRGCTGALVGRQPFGGARLSGVGSKAGGPDYLLQFMDSRVVTENTMRRGFAAD
jgi:RHH-type transcriptional regulator, proline utilization regulon repressor / proline dehydrogenase / delta 1-pyrroline-5-carboxylate dehydrogenase